MATTEAAWGGFDSDIAGVPGEPGVLRVRIYPRASGVGPVPRGTPRRPQPAQVIVRTGDDPRAIHYIPPERPAPGLSRSDYERRAVELVQRLGAGT